MRFSAAEILPIASPNGFDPGVVEKVLHLVHLLNALNSHPWLRGKWVLKGGTALNLFVLRHPRLSIDIDLNYIGALEREEMLADRPKIEQAAQAVFSREGFAVRRMPSEHAGGKWRLSYTSFTGQPANLDLDFNFMYRLPLWEIRLADSHPLGHFQAKRIPVLDPTNSWPASSRRCSRASKRETCSTAIAFSIGAISSANGSASPSLSTGA